MPPNPAQKVPPVAHKVPPGPHSRDVSVCVCVCVCVVFTRTVHHCLEQADLRKSGREHPKNQGVGESEDYDQDQWGWNQGRGM